MKPADQARRVSAAFTPMILEFQTFASKSQGEIHATGKWLWFVSRSKTKHRGWLAIPIRIPAMAFGKVIIKSIINFRFYFTGRVPGSHLFHSKNLARESFQWTPNWVSFPIIRNMVLSISGSGDWSSLIFCMPTPQHQRVNLKTSSSDRIMDAKLSLILSI